MKIGIKLLTKDAVIPAKGTAGAAAYDLIVPNRQFVKGGRNIIKLNWAIDLPKGYCAEIEPRSGYSAKGFVDIENTRLDCDVIHGLIDEDYKGEVGVIVINRDRDFFVEKGQRIAQMLIHKVDDTELFETDLLSESERNQGGFGSTGN
jgi:dUTP pyrophosphatase